MQANPHARYLYWMFAVLVGTIALCGAINVFVDPLGIFGSPRLAGINATKPYLDHHRVLARWQAARRLCADVGIFGNSRAEIGLDPEHTVFGRLGLTAFNHAIPGSSITNSVQQLGWLQQAGCAPKEIVLGVEFFDFLGGSPVKAPLVESAAPKVGLDVLAETVFSITGLHDSLTTLAVQRTRYPATLTERGFNPLRNYVPEVEHAGHYVLFRQRAEENLKRWVRKAPRIHTESGGLSEDFAGLDAFLKQAASAGSTVRLVIYPYHAEILLMMDRADLLGLLEQWKAEIVASADKYAKAGMKVEVIDFSGLSAETSEPIPPRGDKRHLAYYWEAGHFKKELGDRMLDRIFGGETGFGIRLDNLTLAHQNETDRQKIRREREANSGLAREVDSLFAVSR
jgi:hypothetical protein